MLATVGGIEVIGEAENGAAAVELTGEALPDVVILDLAMPIMGGREAMELILRKISPRQVWRSSPCTTSPGWCASSWG